MAIEQIDEVKITDVIRELNAESVRYFAQLSLTSQLPSNEKPLLGRFVRLGEIIVFGTTISYGAKHPSGHRSHINHWDLVNYGRHGPDRELTRRIICTALQKGSYLRDQWPIVDAGSSAIHVDQNGKPTGLVLDGTSTGYGRPPDLVRRMTGVLAQQAVGADLEILIE